MMSMVRIFDVSGQEIAFPHDSRISSDEDEGPQVTLLFVPSGKFLPPEPNWATIQVANQHSLAVPELVEQSFFPEPDIERLLRAEEPAATPVQPEKRLPTYAEAIAQVEAYDAAKREGRPFDLAEWTVRKAAEIRKL
ncbi:hypothetical protein DPM33_23570 [Mesorhizobium hawassense]|uniref:Uncharacterized protein n=1 Tax=Mesorhizobium hawassense TaxID=1209954 RepID=A0A330HUZ4_9HYPH|nr:hypothetical protein [Mesorhizobium hawassense]RAZ88507.1 hypothetical protein DPM33_23570 [Mesorhizobium hawassense]